MTRGYFSSFIDNDVYKTAEKDWIVELQQFHSYWFDLLHNPIENIPSREIVIQYLAAIRKHVEENLEKRFVYFISSRKRVRFDVSKKPTYGFFDGKLKIFLLVGKEKKRIGVKVDFGDGVKPSITLLEGFITIADDFGNKITASVYDFLEEFGIDLGHNSKVEYVGYTKEPEVRPTMGNHAGLTDVLHRVSNEDNDIFIIFNIFKVMSYAVNSPSMMNFIVPNSMTDEISVDLEGRILEKCFILYFDSSNQVRNKSKERAELTNNLKKLVHDNRINAIHVCYEPDEPNEYSILYSSKIPPLAKHVFTVKLADDELCITPKSDFFQ